MNEYSLKPASTASKPLSNKLNDFEKNIVSNNTNPNNTIPRPPSPPDFPGAFSENYDEKHNPDTIAFYAPRCFYDEKSWGIYIVANRFYSYIRSFHKSLNKKASLKDCFLFLRYYLFSHERFHYRMENFSRKASKFRHRNVYKLDHHKVYNAEISKDYGEEALAECFALKKVNTHANSILANKNTYFISMYNELVKQIKTGLPGYRKGPSILNHFYSKRDKYCNCIIDKDAGYNASHYFANNRPDLQYTSSYFSGTVKIENKLYYI